MSNKFLFWLLVVFNILDILLTLHILGLGGVEANPWPNYLITHFGVLGLVLGKTLPLAVFGIILYNYWDRLHLKIQVSVHNVLIMLNLAFGALMLYFFSLIFLL